MPSAARDAIAAMVLRSVQHHLVTSENNPPALLPAPPNVERVSSYSPRPNVIKVIVHTTDQGIRQFTIRTTEDKLVSRDRT
jgi:hypothetical protein